MITFERLVPLFFFGALLFFIAFVLINNTIRISVYSKRFIINTMKLVVATWGFIRKPFLAKGITHGFYASLLAILLLVSVVYLAEQEFYEVINFGQVELLAAIFGLVIVAGIIVNLLSTYFAVNKYLRLSR